MDIIYECAKKYKELLNTEYHLVISKSRRITKFILDFCETDFYHLAGLQYLYDIDINKDRSMTIWAIEQYSINDSLLESSEFYHSAVNEEKDIASRIDRLRYLESYLDSESFISLHTVKSVNTAVSKIDAEYVIESWLKDTPGTVYIFLRKRKESEHYCVVSFFQKSRNLYGDETVYWMKREKYKHGNYTKLFQNPSYHE